MDKMIIEIDYIYTLQEITDIVDKLFSPDDYILDESGRYILGIRNIEESRKRIYITKLLLKLRDINEKIKNGDFNIGYRYTYEEIQNMKDDRQKIYNTLCKELNISVKEEETKTIPNELNNDNTKMILQKAIDAGLCDDNYKWKKTKRLLAYFVDKACEYLEISIGQYDGREKVKWKPFEELFGIDNLAQAKKDYQREGQIPKGSEIVDRIFNSN